MIDGGNPVFELLFNVTPYSISKPLNAAYLEWKNSPCVGKKYVWFEHHAEIYFGIKGTVDYTRRTFKLDEVVDQEKYLLFVLKYS